MSPNLYSVKFRDQHQIGGQKASWCHVVADSYESALALTRRTIPNAVVWSIQILNYSGGNVLIDGGVITLLDGCGGDSASA